MPSKSDVQSFIEAAKVYTDIGENRRRQENDEATRSDNYLLNQAKLRNNAFELQKSQYEFDLKQEQDRKARQEQALITNAFKSSSRDRISKDKIDTDEALSNQLIEVGKAVSGVNPKLAIEFITQAGAFKAKAKTQQIQDLAIKAAKLEAQGDIASMVTDQASADEAVQKMSELDVIVPERYRTYTPEAQEWWKRRAIQSKAFQEANKIAIKEKEFELQEDNVESLISKRKADVVARERKETQARDKITQGRKLAFEKPKEQALEIKLLADQDERFADLDSTLQKVVVRDVQATAAAYLKDDPELDQSVALQRARRTVLDRIDEEGNYKVIADEETPAKSEVKDTTDWKAQLGSKYKPGYRYWIENGRIKGEPV